MKLHLKISLIFLLSVININSSYSQNVAQLTVEYGTMKTLIDQGLEKVDGILENRIAQIYSDLSSVVTQLDGTMKDLLNNVDRKLSKKEQNLYNQIRNLNLSLSTDISSITTTIQNEVLNLSNTAMKFSIFGNKAPWVTSLKIPTLTTKQSKTVLIEIDGVNLDNSRNSLVINGKEINDPIISGPNSIKFKVNLTDSDMFQTGINELKLTLHKRRRPRTFAFIYKVYPFEIGKVIVEYKTMEDKRVFSDQKSHLIWKSASSSNSWKEGKHWINKVNTNTTDKVWKIYKPSVAIKKTQSADGGSECILDLNETNSDRIRARVKAKGTGCCDYKAGQTKCSITWKEYYDTLEPTIKSKEINLNFDTQEIIHFEDNTENLVSIKIVTNEGESFLYDQSVIPVDFPVKANYDNSRKQMLLKFVK